MSQEKKETLAKIVYEIEIEVIQEERAGSIKQEKIITVKKKSDERYIKTDMPFADKTSTALEHLNKHLPKEIEDLITNLYTVEGTIVAWGKDDGTSYGRDLVIKKMDAFESKKRRERLNVGRGKRKQISGWGDLLFSKDCKLFIADFRKIVEKLRKEKAEVTPTAIANEMFSEGGNPLQALRRKLKGFYLTFDGLLNCVIENKNITEYQMDVFNQIKGEH